MTRDQIEAHLTLHDWRACGDKTHGSEAEGNWVGVYRSTGLTVYRFRGQHIMSNADWGISAGTSVHTQPFTFLTDEEIQALFDFIITQGLTP